MSPENDIYTPSLEDTDVAKSLFLETNVARLSSDPKAAATLVMVKSKLRVTFGDVGPII